MPYRVYKTGKKTWGVKNTATGRWHSKRTSRAKAGAQANLLRGVKHGWKPTGAPAKKRTVRRGTRRRKRPTGGRRRAVVRSRLRRRRRGTRPKARKSGKRPKKSRKKR